MKQFYGLRSGNKITAAEVVNHDGRQYIKTSAIIAKEGIYHNIFLSFDVLSDSVKLWQGRPIIMPLHLLNTPTNEWPAELLAAHTYGFIDNPTVDTTSRAIRADLFFELDKLTSSPYKSTLSNLLENKPINNSIGFINNPILKSGNYKGADYNFAFSKIEIADHLAVLPYTLGACSINNGCGVGLSEGGRMSKETENTGGPNFDYQKLGEVIATAIIEVQKTTAAKQVNLSDNEPTMCELKTMIVQLSEEIKTLETKLVAMGDTVTAAFEKQDNKLAIALQGTITGPNGNTTTDNPDDFEIG